MYSNKDSRPKYPVQDLLFPIYGIKTAKKMKKDIV